MSAESAPNPPWALTRLSPAVTPSNLKPIDAAISRKNNKPAMTRQKKTTHCLRVRPSELCCCVVLMSVIILSAANGAFGQAAFGAAPGGAGGASNSAAAGLLPFPEGQHTFFLKKLINHFPKNWHRGCKTRRIIFLC